MTRLIGGIRTATGSIPSIGHTIAHTVGDSCQTMWAFETGEQGMVWALHAMLRAERLQETTKTAVVQYTYSVCPTWKAELKPDSWKRAGSKQLFLHKNVNRKHGFYWKLILIYLINPTMHLLAPLNT